MACYLDQDVTLAIVGAKLVVAAALLYRCIRTDRRSV
jgi:hypothetical protein